MSTNKKAALAGTAQNTTAGANCTEVITVIKSINEFAPCCFADGSVHSRDKEGAQVIEVREIPVRNLDEVDALLEQIRTDTNSAIVQGRYVGDEKVKRSGDGSFISFDAFVDRPSRLVTFRAHAAHVDGPDDLEAKISLFRRTMPKIFHGKPFVWRLRVKGKTSNYPKDMFKIYLTFWMDEPMTLAQVRALYKKETPAFYDVDRIPFPETIIPTSDPVFKDCPVDATLNRRGYFQEIEPTYAVIADRKVCQEITPLPGDKITILETLGPRLTKAYIRYEGEDKTQPYGDAASFKVASFEASSLREVADKLGKLHKNAKKCFIRGKFVGEDKAQPGFSKGTWARVNANFDDQPLHWFMIDIDGFKPNWSHPVETVASSVMEYIDAVLPPCFKGASFYWHLSSSAGMPGKEDFLKCHVHFWSKTPYTSAQMKVWAKGTSKLIDAAVYSRVQVHYTADPVFKNGRVDPVKVRAGWHQGEHDEVDLVIGEEVLAQAHTSGSGTGGNDMKLKDPSEKEGLIGLFHNTFDAEDALLTLLDEFEQVSQRRYTWLEGGGTPEGVWVHDDGMHIGSSHNTWPIAGIANLWDVVRVIKFGKLDYHEDKFEQLNIESLPVGARPSDQAMYEWADQLPEIKAARKEEREGPFARCKALLEQATDSYDLEKVIAPEIQREACLSATEREQLALAVQARIKSLTSVNLPIKEARRLIAPPRQQTTIADAPDWAKDFCWVAASDKFANISTKMTYTKVSYDAKFNRRMREYADEGGNIPKASDYALDVWETQVVDQQEYAPGSGVFFQRDGLDVLNTYRPELLPKMPAEFDFAGRKAIDIIEEHTEILIPDDRECRLFLDYLAFCVQNPGTKIRWAPLLKGVEGDGKSSFLKIMGLVLGSLNIRTLDSSTLETSSFSSWARGQCFTGVEEVKLHGHNKYDIYNKLKPLISNDCIEVHPKGKDPYNVPNTTNYLLLSNFDDAVPVTDNDRRIMFLRSPFNTKNDMFKAIKERTGLSDTDYFDRLAQAINGHAGTLRKWLMERKLSDEFRANGRAPITAAREMAVDLSVRDDESAISSLLDDGGLGIYLNLVSITCLNNALRDQQGIKLNTGRAKAVLTALGFQPFTSGGKNQTKWKGKNHPFYYRGTRPLHAGQEADRLEKERSDALVGQDFSD